MNFNFLNNCIWFNWMCLSIRLGIVFHIIISTSPLHVSCNVTFLLNVLLIMGGWALQSFKITGLLAWQTFKSSKWLSIALFIHIRTFGTLTISNIYWFCICRLSNNITTWKQCLDRFEILIVWTHLGNDYFVINTLENISVKFLSACVSLQARFKNRGSERWKRSHLHKTLKTYLQEFVYLMKYLFQVILGMCSSYS